MKRKRFSEEQIIAILKEAQAGAKKQDIYRKARDFGRIRCTGWRAKYGGLQVPDASG